MIIQTNNPHPGAGYPQQTYIVSREGWYTPNAFPSITTPPPPQHSNHHHYIVDESYVQPQKYKAHDGTSTESQHSHGYNHPFSGYSTAPSTTGYVSYYQQGQAPTGGTKVQPAAEYEYSSTTWDGNGGPYQQTCDQQYPGKCYRKVEYYRVKGV